MSPWSEEQTRMLAEQNLGEMMTVDSLIQWDLVGAEGEMPDGTLYVWSGVRWFKKREDTWR